LLLIHGRGGWSHKQWGLKASQSDEIAWEPNTHDPEDCHETVRRAKARRAICMGVIGLRKAEGPELVGYQKFRAKSAWRPKNVMGKRGRPSFLLVSRHGLKMAWVGESMDLAVP
jgi:hypothetical protein